MSKKNCIENQLEKIDAMSGLDFEIFVANLLKKQGYVTTNLKGSGDFGVDVIAKKGGIKYAVQVKRYKSSVSRTAVSDAVAGKFHWQCDESWVFTSSYFTADAKKLAESTGCKLTDRDDLTHMLYEQKQWRQQSNKRRKKAFANFIFTLLLSLVVIFLISQTNPKVYQQVKTRLFAPVKNLVLELPAQIARAFKPKEETKSPSTTLTPVKDVPLKTPKLDDDGVPILQPIE